MSGICGFNFDDKALLKRMCDLVKHRGPNDKGYYVTSEISIGTRISILNEKISSRHPIHNENEDIWLVCDGKIYNYSELKELLERNGHSFNSNMNTEVIIHSYEQWGYECLNKFRGVFSFCLYDSKQKKLFLARDHMGIKPLYYYFDGKNFIFGSEIKCILSWNIRRELNKRAFSYYLSLFYVPFELTLIKRIFKVPSSCYLIFDLKSKKLELKRYWNLIFKINNEKNEGTLAKELKDLIFNSIKIRLEDDIPIGVFLSGGIDSSAVVGVLSNLIEKPVKTFSVKFEEGSPVDETKFSRLVSEFNNTDHTELLIKSDFCNELPTMIWHNDDLISDPGFIPVYLMAKQVKKNVNLVFTGDGADEVFAGYSPYYREQKYDFLKFIPKNFFDLIIKFYKYIPTNRLRNIINYNYHSKSEEDIYFRNIIKIFDLEKFYIIPFEAENIKTIIKKKFIEKLDIINQFTLWDLKHQLPNQFNIKADRTTSAASLTARTPFLDRYIVSLSLNIPSNLKLKGSIEKYILRISMKDFMPPEIMKRKKLGFGTPVNFWLKNGLKDFSEGILRRLEKRKTLIKQKYIRKCRTRRNLNTWNLIMFELWYETFIENNELKPINL